MKKILIGVSLSLMLFGAYSTTADAQVEEVIKHSRYHKPAPKMHHSVTRKYRKGTTPSRTITVSVNNGGYIYRGTLTRRNQYESRYFIHVTYDGMLSWTPISPY